jgi:hypothetical protein
MMELVLEIVLHAIAHWVFRKSSVRSPIARSKPDSRALARHVGLAIRCCLLRPGERFQRALLRSGPA